MEVASIDGQATASRAIVARLLVLIPAQRDRAARIIHPPGLVILSRIDGDEAGPDGARPPAASAGGPAGPG